MPKSTSKKLIWCPKPKALSIATVATMRVKAMRIGSFLHSGRRMNRCADSVRPEHGKYAEGSPYASGEHNVAFRMPA